MDLNRRRYDAQEAKDSEEEPAEKTSQAVLVEEIDNIEDEKEVENKLRNCELNSRIHGCRDEGFGANMSAMTEARSRDS